MSTPRTSPSGLPDVFDVTIDDAIGHTRDTFGFADLPAVLQQALTDETDAPYVEASFPDDQADDPDAVGHTTARRISAAAALHALRSGELQRAARYTHLLATDRNVDEAFWQAGASQAELAELVESAGLGWLCDECDRLVSDATTTWHATHCSLHPANEVPLPEPERPHQIDVNVPAFWLAATDPDTDLPDDTAPPSDPIQVSSPAGELTISLEDRTIVVVAPGGGVTCAAGPGARMRSTTLVNVGGLPIELRWRLAWPSANRRKVAIATVVHLLGVAANAASHSVDHLAALPSAPPDTPAAVAYQVLCDLTAGHLPARTTRAVLAIVGIDVQEGPGDGFVLTDQTSGSVLGHTDRAWALIRLPDGQSVVTGLPPGGGFDPLRLVRKVEQAVR